MIFSPLLSWVLFSLPLSFVMVEVCLDSSLTYVFGITLYNVDEEEFFFFWDTLEDISNLTKGWVEVQVIFLVLLIIFSMLVDVLDSMLCDTLLHVVSTFRIIGSHLCFLGVGWVFLHTKCLLKCLSEVLHTKCLFPCFCDLPRYSMAPKTSKGKRPAFSSSRFDTERFKDVESAEHFASEFINRTVVFERIVVQTDLTTTSFLHWLHR